MIHNFLKLSCIHILQHISLIPSWGFSLSFITLKIIQYFQSVLRLFCPMYYWIYSYVLNGFQIFNSCLWDNKICVFIVISFNSEDSSFRHYRLVFSFRLFNETLRNISFCNLNWQCLDDNFSKVFIQFL